MAKGFKGKYFSFSAICATTSSQTLHSQCSTFVSHTSFSCKIESVMPEDPLEVLLPEDTLMEPDSKVSHLAPP
jgi:hypothetical protein